MNFSQKIQLNLYFSPTVFQEEQLKLEEKASKEIDKKKKGPVDKAKVLLTTPCAS
jgi:hypothetical protein